MTDNASRQRRARGNVPGWDLDLAYGEQAELFVTDIAESIRKGMVEVKRDGRWQNTGNLYVERQCRRGGEYRDSGIKTSDADLWAFVLGDTEVAIIMPRGLLLQLCADLYAKGKWYHLEERDGTHPTKGVKVPLGALITWLQRRQKQIERGAA